MPDKPSENEQEYFQRLDMERVRAAREKAARETAAQEAARLKQLHWMRCPKCGMELAEVEFRGVTVDACFACGGMYFDSGEVDKLDGRKEPGLLGRMSATLFGRDAG